MLYKIQNTNLFIGNKDDEKNINKGDFVIIHACKSYFDQIPKSNIYKKNTKIKELNEELFLNWVDLPESSDFDIDTFNLALGWMKENYTTKKEILIHCDWGQSRSPTLAMVFMAKILKILPDNFYEALKEFKILYPEYVTPSGISKFVKENWRKLGSLIPYSNPINLSTLK